MPSVRSQFPKTCAICAILSAAEQDILRNLAVEEPGRQPDIYFDGDTFVMQYETDIDDVIGKGVFFNKEDRPIDLLKIFQRDGVRAYSRSGEWSGGKMIKISNVKLHIDMVFRGFENIIASGCSIVGGFPFGQEFMTLGPDDIYEFSPVHIERQPAGVHMVLFVGTGTKGGREFLAFLNSKGIGFGKKGVGKIYFDQIYKYVYTLHCRAPPPPLPAGNPDLMVASSGDDDDTLGSSGAASDGNNMPSFSNAPDGNNAQSSKSPTQSLSQAGKGNIYDDDPASSSCAIEMDKHLARIDGWLPTAPALGGLNPKLALEHRQMIPVVNEIRILMLGKDLSYGSPGPSDIPSRVVHIRSRFWRLIPMYRASLSTQSSKVEMMDSHFNRLGDGSDDAIIIIRDGIRKSQFSQVMNAKLIQVIKAYQDVVHREFPKISIADKNQHMEILLADAPDNVPPGAAVSSGAVHPRQYALYIRDPIGVSSNQKGRKHKHIILSSGPANSFGTMNTTGSFPSLASSTPSSPYTPGDTISMSLMRHHTSISSPSAPFGAYDLGSWESPPTQIVGMDLFLEGYCLEDKMDLLLLRDGAEVSRDSRSCCVASTKARASAKKSFHFSSDGKLLAIGGHAKKQGYSIRTFQVVMR